MKLTQIATRLFLALSVLAAPLAARAADDKKMDDPLMEPVKSVLRDYLANQKELAKDSLKGVDEHAAAIAKAVKGDDMKMLPTEVARQADSLAGAKDLKQARQTFKPLSASLVKYLADIRYSRSPCRTDSAWTCWPWATRNS